MGSLEDRRYTITHCDRTGMLQVSIGACVLPGSGVVTGSRGGGGRGKRVTHSIKTHYGAGGAGSTSKDAAALAAWKCALAPLIRAAHNLPPVTATL